MVGIAKWRATRISSRAPHIALYSLRMLILYDHMIISFIIRQIRILKYLRIAYFTYANNDKQDQHTNSCIEELKFDFLMLNIDI